MLFDSFFLHQVATRAAVPLLLPLLLLHLLTTTLFVPLLSPCHALDNGLGLTPPMGWNSWNTFHCNIDESLIFETAEVLVQLGLDRLGYRYVNLDDCWMAPDRDGDGKLVGDARRFPRGMKHVGDHLHARGLSFGIYSSAGTKTCAGFPASLGHEKVDAQSFAEWGVDYLKYDNCYNQGIPSWTRYADMRDALNATGRPIFYSLCQWGLEYSWRWAPAVGNAWRTTGDIEAHWRSIRNLFWASQEHAERSQIGAWLDPDMLEVGNGNLTYEENKSHFALWCLAKAPLLLGNDLRNMTNETLQIISNPHLIALHQDASAPQARCFIGCHRDDAWSALVTVQASMGDSVVMIVNWSNESVADLQLSGPDAGVVPRPTDVVEVSDVWTDQLVGTFTLETIQSIPIPNLTARSSVVYRLRTTANPELCVCIKLCPESSSVHQYAC